ncbi:Hypothetical predicted protein [Olea europaea subsp. europaea]|uniref:Uncharacterized protein n=1 Tax=Olea europaea subsp. europaea TaxID=158383 RepID=A0A8S0T928_OLEEU|nr:Hypothetical predicted protein [Olea europaea subsp. europaea]
MDLSSLTSKHHTLSQRSNTPAPPIPLVAGDDNITSIGQSPITGFTPLNKPHNQAAALGGNPSTVALAGEIDTKIGAEVGAGFTGGGIGTNGSEKLQQDIWIQIQQNSATHLANTPDRRVVQAISTRRQH